MATKRKSISKKTRFEVFKRDAFTCQYCGKKAPDVVLTIDHIEPVSKGGVNNLLNYITACQDCNSGKSNRRLSDHSIIEKQRKQVEDLQEKREQLEMMFEWQKGLLNIESETIKQLSGYWMGLVPGYYLNESGEAELRRLVKQFSVNEIIDAMVIVTSRYLDFDGERYTKKSVENAWKKISGVCWLRRKEQKAPWIPKVYYIRGILRNRGLYVNEQYYMELLNEAIQVGADIEEIIAFSKKAHNWTDFRTFVENEIALAEERE